MFWDVCKSDLVEAKSEIAVTFVEAVQSESRAFGK